VRARVLSREQGIDTDGIAAWRGFSGPKGLSAAHAAFWDDALAKAVESTDWKQFLEENDLASNFLRGRDFARYLEGEYNVTKAMMSELTTAPAQKSIARNNSPLPKNTVANRRSSRWPRRSRTTPMNQRNATPAKGMRLMASAMVPAFPPSSLIADTGWIGNESRNSRKITISRIDEMIPAIAAAFGVLRLVLVRFLSEMLTGTLCNR